MRLDKLSDWPSRKETKFLLWLGVLVFISFNVLMFYFLSLSNYATSDMISGRLSFNDEIFKEHYKRINIDAYRTAQIMDFGLMFGYGLTLFSLALILARKFKEDSKWRKLGFGMAFFVVFTVWVDVMMNVFLLLTLTNPTGFPEIWAFLCSLFMLLTFISLIFCVSWIISGVVKLKFYRLH